MSCGTAFIPMKKVLLSLACLAGLLAMSDTSEASDHADGIKTALDMTGDISDLYAFTSPSDPSKLVLVMNTHMLATKISRFSDRLSYNFRIKQVESVATLKPVPGGDHLISCSFKGGSVFDTTQEATCVLDGQSSLTFRTNDEKAPAAGGMKAFAGLRADTWFLSIPQTQKVINFKMPEQGKKTNSLAGMKVLSLVVEVDIKKVGGPLIAVTGETVRR